MKHKMILSILVVLLMTMLFTACGKGDEKGREMVAKVGDTEITQQELEQYTYLYAFIQGVDVEGADEETLAYIRKMTLEDLISLKVINLYYENDDKVLPDEYEDSLKSFLEQSEDNKEFAEYMKKHDISKRTLGTFYRDQYFSVPFFDELEKEIREIPETEVKSYYDHHQDEFTEDEVTAKHILVEDKALAEDILAQLKNGADFGKLAAKYSIDGSKDSGGDLGTFGRGKMVTEFEEAAFALQPGELSGVVQTKFGYHIILVTDKNQGLKAYDEVKATIKKTLEDSAMSTVYEKKIGELREQFGVEYAKTETTEDVSGKEEKTTAGAVE